MCIDTVMSINIAMNMCCKVYTMSIDMIMAHEDDLSHTKP